MRPTTGMSGEFAVESVVLDVRREDGGTDEHRAWPASPAEMFRSAAPWRTFRWYDGQRHYSGSYWCATTQGHVIYESRLELARLIYADFDRSVRSVFAPAVPAQGPCGWRDTLAYPRLPAPARWGCSTRGGSEAAPACGQAESRVQPGLGQTGGGGSWLGVRGVVRTA